MSTTSASRAAGRCSRRRPPRSIATDIGRRGPSGPVLFSMSAMTSPCRDNRRLAIVGARSRCRHAVAGSSMLRSTAGSIDPWISQPRSPAYWYFHLPNFILAALMYTMLGRVLLGLMVDADSPNYIWRFFCRITDPAIAVISIVTPEGHRPRCALAVRLRLAVLAARRASLHVAVAESRAPARRSGIMNRNFYFIGIAFFGMINGIFNQLCADFRAAVRPDARRAAAVRQPVADADVRVADGLDRHRHSWRNSGGDLRARHRRIGIERRVALDLACRNRASGASSRR